VSHASSSNRIGPSASAMVGGAIAVAILRLLVKKNVLSMTDVHGVLKTAQRSLACSPAITGTVDGARIIAEIAEQLSGR
jgi:hypothetical protein